MRASCAPRCRKFSLQALRAGDRFPLTLRFGRGGEREVTVWVQQPRDRASSPTQSRPRG